MCACVEAPSETLYLATPARTRPANTMIGCLQRHRPAGLRARFRQGPGRRPGRRPHKVIIVTQDCNYAIQSATPEAAVAAESPWSGRPLWVPKASGGPSSAMEPHSKGTEASWSSVLDGSREALELGGITWDGPGTILEPSWRFLQPSPRFKERSWSGPQGPWSPFGAMPGVPRPVGPVPQDRTAASSLRCRLGSLRPGLGLAGCGASGAN